MTGSHSAPEYQSSPSYLRFTPNESFQQDFLVPLLSPDAIERRHRVSAGLLLSSVAIKSYQEMPRDLALATLHATAHEQFKGHSRLQPIEADYAPLFHPEFNEYTGKPRNMLHGIDIRFSLKWHEQAKLLAVIHPDIDQDELRYITDESRHLHFIVRPQDLAFTPSETKENLEKHLSTVNQHLGNQALRSAYYISSEPNIVTARAPEKSTP